MATYDFTAWTAHNILLPFIYVRLLHASYLLLCSEMAMMMLVKTASRLRLPKRWVGPPSARRWGPWDAARRHTER
jgi:hypothetical protein